MNDRINEADFLAQYCPVQAGPGTFYIDKTDHSRVIRNPRLIPGAQEYHVQRITDKSTIRRVQARFRQRLEQGPIT